MVKKTNFRVIRVVHVHTRGVYLIRDLYQTKSNRLLTRTRANYIEVTNARRWGSLLFFASSCSGLAGVPPARTCALSSYDILTLLSFLRELLLMRNYDVRLDVFYTLRSDTMKVKRVCSNIQNVFVRVEKGLC